MNSLMIVLIAVCESAGVGLVGAVLLRLLRRFSLGVSLIAIVIITVCATNLSLVVAMIGLHADNLSLSTGLIVNGVAGLVSIGIGIALGRVLLKGSRQLASATRAFGAGHAFDLPHDPPAAEFADLAQELYVTSTKLTESRRREQAVEMSRRRLVAWISHDLRSPLARMRAVAESIDDGVAQDLPRYTAKIRADIDHLTEMVDDLFDLSRIQAGTLPLHPHEVGVDDLVSDAVAAVEELAGEHEITVRPRHIDSVPVFVDERRTSRVFVNLLSNAVFYSPAGTSVFLEVRAAGGWVAVSISDQCGGIPPAELDSVFEMGWRGGGAARSGANRGGGLGLAIVQGIVQAHHGKVSVHNTHEGCCFVVWLPVSGHRGPPGRLESF